MNYHYELPALVSTKYLLLVFVVSLVLFDILLVRILKLGDLAWKRFDYIWLSLALVGLIGAVASNRAEVAANLRRLAEHRADTAFSQMQQWASRLSETGWVCRTFVRSEFSPPPEEFNRVQSEYNLMCSWFGEVKRLLPGDAKLVPADFGLHTLPPAPQTKEPALRDALDLFKVPVEWFVTERREADRLRQEAERTEIESSLAFVGPFLIAIALALRITKVTGEIRLRQ